MKVRILSTSDVHGFMYPTNYAQKDDYQPFGYLKASQLIRQIRQANPDDLILYVENGDFLEGSPFTDYAYQMRKQKDYYQRFSKIFHVVKPDVHILGNHEFNYSPKYLEAVYQHNEAPILAANIEEGPNTKIIDGPYKIFEQNGVKVGVIGLTTQYIPHWEKPEHIEGWKFESVYQTAKKLVPQLRPLVDVLVLAYHGGFERNLQTGEPTEKLTGENEGYQLLTQIEGVDALVTGHQHREIAEVIGNVATTQPGYRGANVAEITLELDDKKQVVSRKAELHSTEDAAINQFLLPLVNDWQEDVQKWLDQTIAHIDGGMLIEDHMQARTHGHPYLELVNRVQMEALGADVAGTALFNDEVRGLDEEVTIRNVMNSYVYPNTLMLEEISGADMKAALERSASFFVKEADGSVGINPTFADPKPEFYNYDYYSGIDYTIDINQPFGQRITSLKYHGKDLKADDKLKVVINQYRGIGGGDYPMFSADKALELGETEVSRLIIAYLKAHPELKIKQPTNLTFVD